MKRLKIQGRYEGYVSVFGSIQPHVKEQLKLIDERSERIDFAEQSTNYVVFSNGIDPENLNLIFTLDGELIFTGLVSELPSSYDIADREDLPRFESLGASIDSNLIPIILQEWFEIGGFELEAEVSNAFTLADLEAFVFDLEQGDAVSWALFDQANFEITHNLGHFVIEGAVFPIVGGGDGINHSTNFMKISDEGKIYPDFDLD